MDVFDDLPHFLKAPPTEAVFVSMVRELLKKKDHKMKLSDFGRHFQNAKQVFLEPFFEVENRGGSNPIVKLRYPHFDDVIACAEHHWESRLDLKCRKGHALEEMRDYKGPTSLCFGCNFNQCGNGHYRCKSGCRAFQVCSSCMIKKPTPATVVSTPAPMASPSVREVLPPSPDVPRHAPSPDVPCHAPPPDVLHQEQHPGKEQEPWHLHCHRRLDW